MVAEKAEPTKAWLQDLTTLTDQKNSHTLYFLISWIHILNTRELHFRVSQSQLVLDSLKNRRPGKEQFGQGGAYNVAVALVTFSSHEHIAVASGSGMYVWINFRANW